jgi:hypothetical protein
MEVGTEIDIWFGVDAGYGRKISGKFIGPSSTPDRIEVQITDKDFLEMIGCEDDPEPYIASAYRLGEDHWVYYDDYAWSPKDEIKDEDLVDGELRGHKRRVTKSMDQLHMIFEYMNLFSPLARK